MTHDGDVLRAAADAMPATSDPWGWLVSRAHELDRVGRLDVRGGSGGVRGNVAGLLYPDCGTCHLDADHEIWGHVPMNPDCRGGKHQACAGDAWDDENDVRVDCACGCHERSRP